MKRKLPRILIVPLLFFSCQDDMLEKMESLTPAGEQFMELVSTYGDWRSDWDKLNEMGTPLPNEASKVHAFSLGGYYVYPSRAVKRSSAWRYTLSTLKVIKR